MLVYIPSISYIDGMARKPRRLFSFKITADDEALLRAYADATDQTMTAVLTTLIRSLKAPLKRLAGKRSDG
jgi:hypothetical protein